MTSAWSQLEQMLTCAICLDKFKNPRLLPCQHSFCGDACMEGLVDYARRQIKCPECRAEHRIPYQGVSSLPSNVTLIRFLELHSRITGEEPEPVPTFMEKCAICGEKVAGVQKCWHCEKKVCPECKEAHVDLLRREISRLNDQSKRCLNKLQEFKETLGKSQDRLKVNHNSIKQEIEESTKRLIDDLKAKQKRLLEEVDLFAEQEEKTISKLKLAIDDELKVLESNIKLANDKIGNKYQWTDQELSEMKEIYIKAMEFVRLFDPEIGDFTRKIRFNLIPEFETLRRRICELGELKFSETASSLIASSLQYCNATGLVALELCNSAATQAAASMAASTALNSAQNQQSGYGLAHSNSNTNLGASNQPSMLELPMSSMQNALMRSQSDHRLASQFQQRLKQQQQDSKNSSLRDRYGLSSTSSTTGAGRDYESESLRSRYAPPRSSNAAKDYASDLLTRDWPRPSDNDAASDVSFGSSIHFKSAFMRRKEKERHQMSGYNYNNNDDDDDLTSEASYGPGGRNVRFFENQNGFSAGGASAADQAARMSGGKLFDCPEVERAPLSGVPKLEDSPHLLNRLQQMAAKAVVDKKLAEEEGRRDKDLVESARLAMSKASENRLKQRQLSEDEIEKQKRANQQQQATNALASSEPVSEEVEEPAVVSEQVARSSVLHNEADSGPRHSPAADLHSSSSTVVEADSSRPQLVAASSQPSTPPASSSSSSAAGGRRSLYGQAVTEKSKRQLSNAVQEAVSYSTARSRRNNAAALASSNEGDLTPDLSTASNGSTSTSSRPKRMLRSAGRSMSKQTSVDQASGSGNDHSSGTGAAARRRRLTRGDSSQQSLDSSSPAAAAALSSEHSKNLTSGSGGYNGDSSRIGSSAGAGKGSFDDEKSRKREDPLTTEQLPSRRSYYTRRASSPKAEQTSTTTDDDDQDNNDDDNKLEEMLRRKSATPTSNRATDYGVTGNYYSSRPSADYGSHSRNRFNKSALNDDSESDGDNEPAGKRTDEPHEGAAEDHKDSSRSLANRTSREFLPNSVNKLLDRSAQIRRDSQEQRSRGDSPQRDKTSGSPRLGSTQTQSSFYSAARPGSSSATAGGYSSSPGTSAAYTSSARQRLAYQRSKSIRDDDDDTETRADLKSANNSSNSIYTTASSASSQRKSSVDDEFSSRRYSGNSTDRTLISDHSRPSYHLGRDSSTDNSPSGGYQSRFLARSRTSAALQSTSSHNASGNRYQDADSGAGDASSVAGDVSSGARSYLSSRDRFMQSASVQSGNGPSTTASSSSTTGTTPTSFSRNGSSAVLPVKPALPLALSGLGQYRHQPSSRAHYMDNSPYLDFDDEDDDEYSTYFPQPGFKSHSEYLRNKFNRRTSSGSSASSVILKSRSSHAVYSHGSRDEDLDEDEATNNISNENGSSLNDDDRSESFNRSKISLYGRRKSSVGSFDQSGSSVSEKGVYSSKRFMLFKIGSRGSGPGNFTWPRGVAVGMGAVGREIVVADSSNHRVQVFDSNGRFLNEFGSYGSAEGEFDCLAGVAINRSNKSYVVSDRYNHRIQVFDMAGNFIRAFGEFGRDSGKFNLPWGVACDSGGLIYVCDKENHRIQVFDIDGTYLNKFGACGNQSGQLQHPHYIAVGRGKIVVTDTNNHRVQMFDLGGGLLQSFGREGSQEGEFKFPRGVAMDEQGMIIVGDSGNNRLQIFTPDGVHVKSLGTWGSSDGEFKGIEGVAVDTSNNILVCDRENHRIQVF